MSGEYADCWRAGYLAREHGEPRECPWDDSNECDAWFAGWDKAHQDFGGDHHQELMDARRVRHIESGEVGPISEVQILNTGEIQYMFHPRGGRGRFVAGDMLELVVFHS